MNNSKNNSTTRHKSSRKRSRLTQTELFVKNLGVIPKSFKIAGFDESNDLTEQYSQLYTKLRVHTGLRNTVSTLKAFYAESLRLASKQEVKGLTTKWYKRDSDNYPVQLSSFKDYIVGDDIMKKRYALSVLRSYESISLPVVCDLSTILDPSEGTKWYSCNKLPFDNFVKRSRWGIHTTKLFRRECSKQRIKLNYPKLHYNTRTGIEGPTCLTAGIQSLAITPDIEIKLINFLNSIGESQKWLEILKANQYIYRNSPDDLNGKQSEKSKIFLGRLAFIPDKAGKTRLVAIGNYWIQNILLYLHDIVYGILKEMGSDGTYNQTSQFDRVLAASGQGPVWSFDLSAATDRFPIEPQAALLNLLAGNSLGTIWMDLVKVINFEFDKKPNFYEVGQPMGLYSSWAVFTLTHHAIVQYSASIERVSYPFSDYAIIGDDVAIWNKKVAKRYQVIIEDLGVSINWSKSFIPLNEGPCAAEFAKRNCVRGVEIGGIAIDLQVQAFKHWSNVPEFLRYLRQHNILVKVPAVSGLIKLFRVKPREIDQFFCLLRINEVLNAHENVVLWDLQKPSWLNTIEYSTILSNRMEVLDEQSKECWASVNDPDTSLGLVPDKELSLEIKRKHYFTLLVKDRFMAVENLEEKIVTELMSSGCGYTINMDTDEIFFDFSDYEPGELPHVALSDLEYLPKCSVPSILADLKRPAKRTWELRARFVHKLAKRLTETMHIS